LYSKIANNLNDSSFRFIAYTSEDQKKLISDGWCKTIIDNLEDGLKAALHEASDEADLDREIMLATENEFTLTKSIFADRALKRIDFSAARKQSLLIYSFWKNYVETFRPDFVIHEPCTLSINFIGACILKNRDARMIAFIQLNGFLDSHFAVVDAITGGFIDYNEAKNGVEYIKRLQKNSQLKWHKSQPLLVSRLMYSMFSIFKNIKKAPNDSYHNIVNNYLIWESSKISNVANLLIRDLFVRKSRNLDGLKYYFYPLHIEPESTVLYWGKYSYNDQIALIKLIAANLPSDTVLIVKDHPHLIGYRNFRDYHSISALPNVILVPVQMNSSYLIKNSLGIITINGTAGIEALMHSKPVLCFGNIYYSHLKGCQNFLSERDFTRFFKGIEVDSEEALNYYVSHSLSGFTSYFPSSLKKNKGLDEERNAKEVTDNLEGVLKSALSFG